MDSFFILILELFVDPTENPIFYGLLWQNSNWTIGFIISAFAIPIISLLVFYLLIDPPLGRSLHWFLTLLIGFLISLGIAYFTLYNFFDNIDTYGCIVNPEQCGFSNGQSPLDNFLMASLPIGIFSVIVGFLTSWPIKYFSINNKKNPF